MPADTEGTGSVMQDPLTNAPVLTTERLVLRGPRRGDLPAFTDFMTTAPSLAAQGDLVSAEQAWFGFLAGVGHWHWHGFGLFVLTTHGNNDAIGRVGLLKHSNWPCVELAWHLFEGAEGRGFATEAARAVQSWAQKARGISQLHSFIDRNNLKSQAVARRLGAATDGTRATHEPEAEIWTHVPIKG